MVTELTLSTQPVIKYTTEPVQPSLYYFPLESILIISFHLFLHLSCSFLTKYYVGSSAYVIPHLYFVSEWITMSLILYFNNGGRNNEVSIDIRDIQQVWFPKSQKLNEKSLQHQT